MSVIRFLLCIPGKNPVSAPVYSKYEFIWLFWFQETLLKFCISHHVKRVCMFFLKVQLSRAYVANKALLSNIGAWVCVCVVVYRLRLQWLPVFTLLVQVCVVKEAGSWNKPTVIVIDWYRTMDSWVCPNDRQLALRAKYVTAVWFWSAAYCLWNWWRDHLSEQSYCNRLRLSVVSSAGLFTSKSNELQLLVTSYFQQKVTIVTCLTNYFTSYYKK